MSRSKFVKASSYPVDQESDDYHAADTIHDSSYEGQVHSDESNSITSIKASSSDSTETANVNLVRQLNVL